MARTGWPLRVAAALITGACGWGDDMPPGIGPPTVELVFRREDSSGPTVSAAPTAGGGFTLFRTVPDEEGSYTIPYIQSSQDLDLGLPAQPSFDRVQLPLELELLTGDGGKTQGRPPVQVLIPDLGDCDLVLPETGLQTPKNRPLLLQGSGKRDSEVYLDGCSMHETGVRDSRP